MAMDKKEAKCEAIKSILSKKDQNGQEYIVKIVRGVFQNFNFFEHQVSVLLTCLQKNEYKSPIHAFNSEATSVLLLFLQLRVLVKFIYFLIGLETF